MIRNSIKNKKKQNKEYYDRPFFYKNMMSALVTPKKHFHKTS